MKILHVYKDYYPVLGGIENHLRWLAEAQAAAGHEVTVLVCNGHLRSGEAWYNGVRVLKAGRLATLASMPLSLQQPLMLASLKADIAHLHAPYPLGEVANWLLGRARATVLTHHTDIVRQRWLLRCYAPLLRRLLHAVDAIIATSPTYVATSPWLRPERDRCTVVPLGIDPARFNGAVGERTSLLFVGRLRYYKGLDTLLQAMTWLPETRLVVVGDGPMGPTWQRLAGRLGLQERVAFVGEVPDDVLAHYYARAALFVLSANSRAEAFGTVLLEAMAAGVPVVSTELGTGTSWVNQDGVTGRVVPPDDPPVLACVLRELLDAPEARRRMGQAGRARVQTEFDLTTMARRVEAVYEKVLSRKRSPVTVAC